jgi:hypothetical protein
MAAILFDLTKLRVQILDKTKHLNQTRRRLMADDILNFVIAGAQRSATTSLKQAMNQHPDIRFLSNKEEALSHEGQYVGYPFATPFYTKSLHTMLDSETVYRSISQSAGKAKYIGTKWPYFMIWPHIACNMRQHLPGLQLIFILRNPMDCLWSSYKKSYKGDALQQDFAAYVQEGKTAIEDSWKEDKRGEWPHMLFSPIGPATSLDRGFYFPQLINFVLLFGWEQIHVINYRDFAEQPNACMHKLFTWMELPVLEKQQALDERYNAVSRHAPPEIASAVMDPAVRSELEAFYEPSNRELCKCLGWDYSRWISN